MSILQKSFRKYIICKNIYNYLLNPCINANCLKLGKKFGTEKIILSTYVWGINSLKMTSKVLSKLFQPHSLLTAQLANKNKYWLANTPTFTAQIIQCFSFSNKVFLKIKSLKKKKKKKKNIQSASLQCTVPGLLSAKYSS